MFELKQCSSTIKGFFFKESTDPWAGTQPEDLRLRGKQLGAEPWSALNVIGQIFKSIVKLKRVENEADQISVAEGESFW